MTRQPREFRQIRDADVYKNGTLAARLSRTDDGGVAFAYTDSYLKGEHRPIAISLPPSARTIETKNGALPPFFSGLLPEGHRLTVLKNAAKTSVNDELTLLLIVGADVPGDVQIVPAGETPTEPDALADTSLPDELDFVDLSDAVDLHGVPGVQDKASASVLTTPLALRGKRYLLKLDPAEYPHLVANEAAHLASAQRLRIPVATSTVIHDRHGGAGLLVERFDRAVDQSGTLLRLPLEDGTQVMGLPPASKYLVTAEEVATALAQYCEAPVLARRNIYLQFVFAWLTGNGDLHAKNLSILGNSHGGFVVAPVYDVPCTLLYGDDTLALSVAGKTKNLTARHWAEFADSLGLPPKAAASANRIAVAAAASLALEDLPFAGSPLRGTQRELRFRRDALTLER
ncbi:type II toxin-antitoxin system HipA family toxin [Mycetocola zhadangensis]|uniref:Type II toxin-antitoxin system HipA family toxin n=1 Tax=Mycetocola zhadangensis TaxID=1164595 RepID=A0A3L7ITQ1_9MICO|nr:HipA domain-containing protein [Mycetocola zhadangensis]RLQ81520.1 type II toxin-antitoxin system HipA family toxin [Mycetocola zhadangensis]RLQ82474.1 type II toxin-antitoxin system HipA family toxin [Mycetocola zhadangensis]GGF01005.1 hypothetical protein GCM10011313_25040 [Mycetocola zhadangensis]